MIRALVGKEARAQAPVLAASLLAVAAAAAFTRFRMFGPYAYLLGAAALGALSIGHEYSHRTLGTLLAQPVPRLRLLLAKLAVLTPMLIVLSAVAVAVTEMRADAALAYAVLPVLAGLFVAPWLTMVCRGPLAGAVFTLTLPGLILSTTALAYLVWYGHGPGQGFDVLVASRGTLAVCLIGSVMTWPAFRRLEAIEGAFPEVRLPAWFGRRDTAGLAAPASRARSVVMALVMKELRLQQMAFVVMGIVPIGWLALTLSLRPKGVDTEEIFVALMLPCGALVAMLIGALASAEERRLGTLEWQLLLPLAAWRQWAIKVAVVVSLALLLPLGVPALLAALSGARVFGWLSPTFAAVVVALAIGSLYVSSLSGSGVAALLAAAPAVLGAGLLLELLLAYQGRVVLEVAARAFGWKSPRIAPSADSMRAYSAVWWLISAAVVGLLAWFGLSNHRSADRASARLRTQVVWLVVAVTAAVTVLAAAKAWLRIPL